MQGKKKMFLWHCSFYPIFFVKVTHIYFFYHQNTIVLRLKLNLNSFQLYFIINRSTNVNGLISRFEKPRMWLFPTYWKKVARRMASEKIKS